MLPLQWTGLDIKFSGHAHGRKSTENRCVWEGEGLGGSVQSWVVNGQCALGRGPPQSVL